MRTGRIIAAFTFFFGVLILPVAILLPVALLTAQSPYIVMDGKAPAIQGGRFVDPDMVLGYPDAAIKEAAGLYPGSEAAVRAEYDGNRFFAVAAYHTPEAAQEGRGALLDRIDRSATTYTLDHVTYTRRKNGHNGLIVLAGNYLLQAEAPDGIGVTLPVQNLSYITENPEKSVLQTWTGQYLGWFLGAIFLYILVQPFIWLRVATWALKISPKVGSAPAAGLQELTARLMAINRLDVPFEIKPGKRENEFIAEWKFVDTKWAAIMSAGRVRGLARIRMRLNPSRNQVRAQDITSKVSWEATGPGPRAGMSASIFKGIHMVQYERGAGKGLMFKNGQLTFDNTYNYTFNLSEMKNPLIETVTGSGWEWVPVVTFLRIFN